MQRRSTERVFRIVQLDGKLMVERRGEPFRKRYVVLLVLTAAVLVLLIGYLMASRLNPRFWFLVALVAIILLAIAERAVRMYNATKPDRFIFDKESETIEHNGETVGTTKDVEAILFRDILDGDRPLNEYAVVVSYQNTRRLLIAESHGLPGEKEELEQVAAALSSYLEVPIRNEPRQADQWWLDRS